MGNESQLEELEVLESIYEGDPNFKQIQNDTCQYKLGVEGDKSTVLIEVKWSPEYPEVVPTFSLGAFYNNHLSSAAKTALLNALNGEAENNVGSQQTFTVIEWAKENYDAVLAPHLVEDSNIPSRLEAMNLAEKDDRDETGKVKVVKKEQLTKSQKRREWDRVDNKGERPRGYDWVDVVKHLSQTGGYRQDFGDSTQPTGQAAPAEYLSAANLPS